MSRGFLDTNILVYAFSEDSRADRARSLLASNAVTGVQCLNEFVNVALNKLKMDWDSVEDALDAIRVFCEIVAPVDVSLHQKALEIARRCRFHIFDALIVGAAIECGCDILWSEDLQDGQVIEHGLTVRNPFLSA